jgi:hypothetical protein
MTLTFKTGGLIFQLCPAFDTFQARGMPFPFDSAEIELVCDPDPAACAQGWFAIPAFTGLDLCLGREWEEEAPGSVRVQVGVRWRGAGGVLHHGEGVSVLGLHHLLGSWSHQARHGGARQRRGSCPTLPVSIHALRLKNSHGLSVELGVYPSWLVGGVKPHGHP